MPDCHMKSFQVTRVRFVCTSRHSAQSGEEALVRGIARTPQGGGCFHPTDHARAGHDGLCEAADAAACEAITEQHGSDCSSATHTVDGATHTGCCKWFAKKTVEEAGGGLGENSLCKQE